MQLKYALVSSSFTIAELILCRRCWSVAFRVTTFPDEFVVDHKEQTYSTSERSPRKDLRNHFQSTRHILLTTEWVLCMQPLTSIQRVECSSNSYIDSQECKERRMNINGKLCGWYRSNIGMTSILWLSFGIDLSAWESNIHLEVTHRLTLAVRVYPRATHTQWTLGEMLSRI